MQVTEVSFSKNDVVHRVKLRRPGPESRKNTFTVVNGDNGSGKSALLRIISDAALGLKMSRQFRFVTKNISISTSEKVSRTIALSGTHNDRFPSNSGAEVRTKSGIHDLMPFFYYGPKLSGIYTSAEKASSITAHSILSSLSSEPNVLDQLQQLLRYMEFDPWIKISFDLGSRTRGREKQSLGLLREHVQDLVSRHPESSLKISNSFFQSLEHAQGLLENHALRQWFTARDEERARSMYFGLFDSIGFDDATGLQEVIASTFAEYPQVLADFISMGVLSAQITLKRHGKEYLLNALSSGEWQLFYTLANLALNVRDDSLVLIDEPENSLHPRWQSDYVHLVRDLMKHRDGCHTILATHSPLIAASLLPFDGNLVRMKRGRDGQRFLTEFEDTAYGWLPGDILKERFEMSTVRPPELTKVINQSLRLLKKSSLPRPELTGVARRVIALRRHLPAHDPLLSVMDAIVEIAFPDSVPEADGNLIG